ncbi:MAG: hypothetical protein GC160_04715 [Acidobacteria bacterium]|nr:hypothetical protein [Acidobacteriota bacterium]
MGIQDWFSGAGKNKRKSARLPALGQVLICRGETPSFDASEGADLMDYSAGGLKVRVHASVEEGQTVWVRTKVLHSDKDGAESLIGVSWETK